MKRTITMAVVALICGACTGLAYANLVSGDSDVGNPTGDQPTGSAATIVDSAGKYAPSLLVKAFAAKDGLCVSSANPDGGRDTSTACVDPTKAPYSDTGIGPMLIQHRDSATLVVGLTPRASARVDVQSAGRTDHAVPIGLDPGLPASDREAIFVLELPPNTDVQSLTAENQDGAALATSMAP